MNRHTGRKVSRAAPVRLLRSRVTMIMSVFVLPTGGLCVAKMNQHKSMILTQAACYTKQTNIFMLAETGKTNADVFLCGTDFVLLNAC